MQYKAPSAYVHKDTMYAVHQAEVLLAGLYPLSVQLAILIAYISTNFLILGMMIAHNSYVNADTNEQPELNNANLVFPVSF